MTDTAEQDVRDATGEDAVTLADALDSFFYDLRYTAPEMWSERVNQLGSRIGDTMAAIGYPKKGAGS